MHSLTTKTATDNFKMLVIFATLISSFFVLVNYPSLVEGQQYAGGAVDYGECERYGILSDKLKCRSDVATFQNLSGKGIPPQGLFSASAIFEPENFSIVSWVTLGVNIAVIAIMVYWVFLIAKGAVKMISSEGNADKIAEAQQQIAAVLRSIVALFIFLAILILAGNLLGFGSIWEWPKSFSQCSNYDNKFYFTVRLELQGDEFVCN